MFVAMGIKAMLSFGSGVWIPELFRRTYRLGDDGHRAVDRRHWD